MEQDNEDLAKELGLHPIDDIEPGQTTTDSLFMLGMNSEITRQRRTELYVSFNAIIEEMEHLLQEIREDNKTIEAVDRELKLILIVTGKRIVLFFFDE